MTPWIRGRLHRDTKRQRHREGWAWGIDNVIPMTEADAQGRGTDRADCMRQFNGAWDRFSAARSADFTADPAHLTEFLQMKRKRL
jgi:hypothetical protein